MHDQLVVQLDVHNVAKVIACVRLCLVTVAGLGWHLRTRDLLCLLLLVQLLMLLVLIDTRAIIHGRKGGKALHIRVHVAEVAVADIRGGRAHTLHRGLLTAICYGELVAIRGPLVHNGQIRAIIRIRLPHRAIAD